MRVDYYSADSVKSAEAVRADPAPKLGLGRADVVAACSALENVVRKFKIILDFTVKFFHKTSVRKTHFFMHRKVKSAFFSFTLL